MNDFQILSSECDRITAIMNAQHLCLPAQGFTGQAYQLSVIRMGGERLYMATNSF